MIKFKQVRFKNFGSFGNYFTTINLDGGKMTLVSGSNGHGKSYAFLDSITFALFGKPFRKINIPQLINSINNKNCLVEVYFSIGTDEYKVLRGLKPKKFEIYKNDELVSQSSKSKDYQKFLEEQILKMNYKSFTQIVTLGSSSFVPFMQLTVADRRQVIEDILDINIFSLMNVAIKAKQSQLKSRTQTITREIEILKEKINIQNENIENLSNKREETIKNNLKKITEIEIQIEKLKTEISSLELVSNKISEIGKNKDTANVKLKESENVVVDLIKNKKVLEKSFNFYEENESCSVCGQNLNLDFKEKKKKEIKDEIQGILSSIESCKKVFYEVKNDIKDMEESLAENSDVFVDLSEKKSSMQAATKYIEKLKSDLELKDSFEDQIKESEMKKRSYTDAIEKNETDYIKLKEKKSNFDILSMLLKDSGIKSRIIKNYLPVINEIINQYLSRMNFFVSFSLDEEFNEVIKSRHRDTFSYMNFSEGEKSRIDLAILLAWREIAKLKNSAHCNILILDEIFDSSLDSVGVDDLMGVLHDLSTNSNIFVITHKSDQLSDKFNNMIHLYKKNNFSRLK